MSAVGAVQPFSAAHRSYVKTLYRRSLKDALDWYVRRDIWRKRAIEIRVMFDKHAQVKDPRQAAAALLQLEKDAATLRHPDPYRPPLFPDGTKWERNIPPRMFSEEEKRAALNAHH